MPFVCQYRRPIRTADSGPHVHSRSTRDWRLICTYRDTEHTVPRLITIKGVDDIGDFSRVAWPEYPQLQSMSAAANQDFAVTRGTFITEFLSGGPGRCQFVTARFWFWVLALVWPVYHS